MIEAIGQVFQAIIQSIARFPAAFFRFLENINLGQIGQQIRANPEVFLALLFLTALIFYYVFRRDW